MCFCHTYFWILLAALLRESTDPGGHMADDLKQTGKADDTRINVVQDHEVKKRITDSFLRGIDGRWTCIEAATSDHPTKNIQFTPGAVFGPEDTFMMVKVAKWLDSLADGRRAGLMLR
jgi:hypothetical protein